MVEQKQKPNYKAVVIAVVMLVHILAYTQPLPWPLVIGAIDAFAVYIYVWPRVRRHIKNIKDK